MSVASAKWNALHKKECALATARWRAKNPDKVCEQNRYFSKSEAAKSWPKKNRAKRRVTEGKWREANKERYRLITKRAQAKYLASHPEKAKLSSRLGQHRRRELLRKTKRCDKASANVLCQLISSSPRLKCGICGKNMPKSDRTIDHIIPVSKGGSGEIWNLRIVHLKCNLEKHAKMPDELNFHEQLP